LVSVQVTQLLASSSWQDLTKTSAGTMNALERLKRAVDWANKGEIVIAAYYDEGDNTGRLAVVMPTDVMTVAQNDLPSKVTVAFAGHGGDPFDPGKANTVSNKTPIKDAFPGFVADNVRFFRYRF